jgi:hypothetical protein
VTAGIPCLGLSGLFIILMAAVTPIWRLARLDRDSVRPVRVQSVLALTAAIAAATVFCWYGLSFLLGLGSGRYASAKFGSFFGVPIIVVSLLMLVAIIVVAEIAAHVLPRRLTPLNPPVRPALPPVRSEPLVHLALGAHACTPVAQRFETTTRGTAPPSNVRPSQGVAVDLRSRQLATQRARLVSALEEAMSAWDQLLEQLDSITEELRLYSRAIATLVDKQVAERTERERLLAASGLR